jgi:predicted Zn-dependent peptidase
MKRNSYQLGGLNVVTIHSEKFKTTDILLNFRNLLEKDTATNRGLIPSILKAGSTNYPTKKAISRELERLYGASFGSNVIKQGLQQILTFKMSLVNDAYLEHSGSVLDDAFKLLADIIFNPKLENGVFEEKLVLAEKRLLAEHFDSLYDNKIRYAYDQLLNHMFKGEKYQVRSIGQKEDLAFVNPTSTYQAYQTMMQEDAIDLFIIGDIDEARIKKLIETYFNVAERKAEFEVLDLEENQIREVNEVVEYQDVSQAKLNIGLRTATRGTDSDYYAMLVLNGMLGGYPHSLLFKNVREKHSLCYYISSTIDRAKGAMFIYAGIEHSDYQKAVDLTLEQIELLKAGEYSQELLDNTKNALINDLLEMNDSPSAILSTDFASLLYHEVYDVQKRIKEIEAIAFDDILQAAKKLKLDTIFYLTKEGGETHE